MVYNVPSIAREVRGDSIIVAEKLKGCPRPKSSPRTSPADAYALLREGAQACRNALDRGW